MPTKKKPPKRFVPTVRQYQEDLTVLRAAGPNVLLKAVLTDGATRRPKPTK